MWPCASHPHRNGPTAWMALSGHWLHTAPSCAQASVSVQAATPQTVVAGAPVASVDLFVDPLGVPLAGEIWTVTVAGPTGADTRAVEPPAPA